MNSPDRQNEEPTSSTNEDDQMKDISRQEAADKAASNPRPPAKRSITAAVIEISDTDSDDSDICAVSSYQASADEVKRIRGADYSTTSSSSSNYSSDSESSCEDNSLLIDDVRKNERKVITHPKLNVRANRMDDPALNKNLKSQELLDSLSSDWKDSKDHASNEATLTCEPFRLCLLHNFLDNPDMLNNIVDDMNTLDWSRKKMDLYEFHQTADLVSLTWQRSIRGIYELLKTEVMALISKITGLELTSVSASCSLYGPGDHLLVHDDMLSDRRVAFILYLAPWICSETIEILNGDHDKSSKHCGWQPSMGGALQLLKCDSNGQPDCVVRSILPANNALAFFKVGPETYHQVDEILSLELPRLSINGWFHGPADTETEPATPICEDKAGPETLKPHTEIIILRYWVETGYMSPMCRNQIQKQMESESEVCLQDFLPSDKLKELKEALEHTDLPWQQSGPANQRHHQHLTSEFIDALDKEHVIKGLMLMFNSNTFIKMLIDCTDLKITGYYNLELQRWRRGDYTLLPSREQYQEPRLEATLYLFTPQHPICGGVTSYLAPEEPESSGNSLITLTPTSNALNLVYCDSGAAGFTKYLSKMTMSEDECFYIVKCTYKE